MSEGVRILFNFRESFVLNREIAIIKRLGNFRLSKVFDYEYTRHYRKAGVSKDI